MRKKKPQVILLTGAASGIGAASARHAISLGHSVLLADINLKGARELAASLGERAHAVELDICSAAQWERALDTAYRHFGQLDILINNAAIVCTGYARDVSLEQHQRTLNTNFMGPLTGTLATLKRFREQGHGHVVTVCSMTAFMPFPGIASYGIPSRPCPGGTPWARALHHPAPDGHRNPDAGTGSPGRCRLLRLRHRIGHPGVRRGNTVQGDQEKVFMPPEQARAVRMLGTDPKKLRNLFDTMEEIGKQTQQARRSASVL